MNSINSNIEESQMLTDVDFWESCWNQFNLPCELDWNSSFDRCLGVAIKENLPSASGKVLEVGCAPGKWLAFMAREFDLRPSGVEYSESGIRLTRENFRLLGIKPDEIIAGDFFKVNPSPQFDVVMSFGFIEHFHDVDAVISLHLKWLKPGGKLILGLPNFRGIYFPIQYVLDKKILAKHNLGIMNLEYFRVVAKRFSLTPVFLEYIGSFQPAGFVAGYRLGNPLQVLIRTVLRLARRIRRWRGFDRYNHSFYSGYILAIYKKPLAE